jgi:hypothetical protein
VLPVTPTAAITSPPSQANHPQLAVHPPSTLNRCPPLPHPGLGFAQGHVHPHTRIRPAPGPSQPGYGLAQGPSPTPLGVPQTKSTERGIATSPVAGPGDTLFDPPTKSPRGIATSSLARPPAPSHPGTGSLKARTPLAFRRTLHVLRPANSHSNETRTSPLQFSATRDSTPAPIPFPHTPSPPSLRASAKREPMASGIPKPSPISVLTRPDCPSLRGADETRYLHSGVAVDAD